MITRLSSTPWPISHLQLLLGITPLLAGLEKYLLLKQTIMVNTRWLQTKGSSNTAAKKGWNGSYTMLG
jgi:hypothetical protein